MQRIIIQSIYNLYGEAFNHSQLHHAGRSLSSREIQGFIAFVYLRMCILDAAAECLCDMKCSLYTMNAAVPVTGHHPLGDSRRKTRHYACMQKSPGPTPEKKQELSANFDK
jgi:hypothetical protein